MTPAQARAALPVLREALDRLTRGDGTLGPLTGKRAWRYVASLRMTAARRIPEWQIGDCPVARTVAWYVATLREARRIAGEEATADVP